MGSTDSDTPQPVSSSPSSRSLQPQRSGVDRMLPNLPGAAVSIYALSKLIPLLALFPFTDPRFQWTALLTAGVCAPTLFSLVLSLVREALSKQR